MVICFLMEMKLKSVVDCYQSQEMCTKAVNHYLHALEFVPECYMAQKMCDKAADIYPSTIKFVLERFMIQEMCDKVVNTYFLYLILFLIGIKPKKCVAELYRKILS